MLSGRLLPAHPKPLQDELLSSWIVRVAEANAVKLQTLTRLYLSGFPDPWSRDIDRQGPPWLLSKLSALTGTPISRLRETTLQGYEGHIFPRMQLSGQLRWILPVKGRSSKRYGYGLQYCPVCLASDPKPYFRRRWRLGFYTFCPEHNTMLFDACTSCGAPVVFHRRDSGKDIDKALGVTKCNRCGYDLRLTLVREPTIYDYLIFQNYSMLLQLPKQFCLGTVYECMEYLSVIHQLCKIVVTISNNGCLEEYVCDKLEITSHGVQRGRFPFEQRRVEERYYVISLVLWIMDDLKGRLEEAWQTKAIRFNLLVKDFQKMPEWFDRAIAKFNRLRHLRPKR